MLPFLKSLLAGPCWRRFGLTWAGVWLLAGCSSVPAPMMENDIDSFTAGVEQVLRTGMPIKEARRALRENLPPPSIDTQVSAPVPSANQSLQTRRFMMGWPTFTTGTTFIVTIFCDRDGRIVRWTTGPFTDER